MYFNNNKKDTNIDQEFKESKNILSTILHFFNKYKIIIIVTIVIILALIMILLFTNRKEPIFEVEKYLVLNGEESITLYQGTDYIEPGYEAYNSKDEDLTKEVTVTSNLNINQIGEYEIVYTLDSITKTRKITITEKTDEYTYIYLNTVNDKVNIYLKKGEKYVEPGYQVFNSTGKDLNDSVKITGNVDTSKKGNYKITYSVLDSNNATISTTRTVIVMDIDIKLSIRNDSNSNDKVYIDVQITDEYFDYLVLPDGSKITDKKYSYTVSKNGKYTFKSYSTKGMSKEASIEVKKIDTKAPVIKSCSAVFKNNNTLFSITSNDKDIAKYVVNNNSSLTYKKNSFTVNGIIKNANITVYDTSNNKTTVACPGYYEQVKPMDSGNIKYKEETDTLKVAIEFNERKSGIDYYTTYIWVKDAYKQFKSQVPYNYGKERTIPRKLIENAVQDNNLQNKLVVGINASGYEASGTYVNTPAMPLIISNGKIIRNDTNNSYVNTKYNTYGMNKYGMLTFYPYAGSNPKTVAQRIMDDGVSNTFGWFYVLVKDGKASYKSNTRSVLQGICQIDENNFVFITDIYESSRAGFTYTSLGEYMVSLGCKTGFNLDGGGSVQLIYTESDGKPIELVTYNTGKNARPMPDVIYFHQ